MLDSTNITLVAIGCQMHGVSTKGVGLGSLPQGPRLYDPVVVEPDEGHRRGGTKSRGGLEEGDLLSLETPGQLRGGRAGPEQQAP